MEDVRRRQLETTRPFWGTAFEQTPEIGSIVGVLARVLGIACEQTPEAGAFRSREGDHRFCFWTEIR